MAQVTIISNRWKRTLRTAQIKKKMSLQQYVECCLQTQSISICTKQEKSPSISNHEANAGVVEDKQSVGEVCKRQHLSEQKILHVNSLLPSVDYCSMERKDINKRKREFKQFHKFMNKCNARHSLAQTKFWQKLTS